MTIDEQAAKTLLSIKDALETTKQNPVDFLLEQLQINIAGRLTHQANWRFYIKEAEEARADTRAEKALRQAVQAELEKLLAECHAALALCDPNTEIGERIENYFAGNGAILYSELEILEEKPVSQVGTEKPADCLSNLIVPIGYELRVGANTETPGKQVAVLLLKHSFSDAFTLLHIGSAPLGLTDDEISSIQKRIDEVVR